MLDSLRIRILTANLGLEDKPSRNIPADASTITLVVKTSTVHEDVVVRNPRHGDCTYPPPPPPTISGKGRWGGGWGGEGR